MQHFYVEATSPLPAGEHQVRMEFAYAGGGLGKGGKVTLYIDGKKVGEGDDPHDAGDDLLRRRRLRRRRGHRRPGLPGLRPARQRLQRRVKGVQIAIADAAENADHLVSPEDAIRIAMARQ